MSVYAFTDLHGELNLLKQIQEYCGKDDTLYFLGDAVDRGPEPLKTLQEVLKDKRITMLCGNHEDMMYDVITNPDDALMLQAYIYDGGFNTCNEIMSLSYQERAAILRNIRRLPVEATYQNINGYTIHLSHAGTTPNKIFNSEKEKVHSLIWDRKHFKDAWPQDKCYKDWIEVHGHTPVSFLNATKTYDEKVKDVVFYCENHKIDIDIGACWTHRVALLNLDTFEIKYFSY